MFPRKDYQNAKVRSISADKKCVKSAQNAVWTDEVWVKSRAHAHIPTHMYSPRPRYNTRMGVSLTTLAKLTNPAMARWWKKRGVWLLGAGIGFGLIEIGLQMFWRYGSPFYFGRPLQSWLSSCTGISNELSCMFFVLCAVLAAGPSLQACHTVGEEHATPTGAAHIALMYALALKRTWPALITVAGFSVFLSLDTAFWWTPGNWDSACLGLLVRAFSKGLDSTSAIWLLVIWLIAWQTLTRHRKWFAPSIVLLLYVLPVIASFAYNIWKQSQNFGASYSFNGIYNHEVHDWRGALAGLLLLVLSLWLQRFKPKFLSSAFWAAVIIASVLQKAFANTPAIQTRIPHEFSWYVIQFSHLGFALARVPFGLIETAMNTRDPAYQSLWFAFVWNPIQLPLWASFLSPLLNLVWLAALYLFISRVLLREPRKRAPIAE